MNSTTLVKHQTKTYGPTIYTEDGTTYKLTVTVRYDDEYGNGHNSFAITGAQYRKNANGTWSKDSFGCLHKEIAKYFPDLAPLLKWHLMSSDGPMHYLANTLYHVEEHGPSMAWVYYTKCQDHLKIAEAKEECLRYVTTDLARQADGEQGYRVQWDEKTIKIRNLDHARSSAVWPDATDEELTAPGLEIRLRARLQKLMEEFHHAVESLGLTY